MNKAKSKQTAYRAGYEAVMYGRPLPKCGLFKQYGESSGDYLIAYHKQIQKMTPAMQAKNRAKLAGKHRAYKANTPPTREAISKQHFGQEEAYLESFWTCIMRKRSRKALNLTTKQSENFDEFVLDDGSFLPMFDASPWSLPLSPSSLSKSQEDLNQFDENCLPRPS